MWGEEKPSSRKERIGHDYKFLVVTQAMQEVLGEEEKYDDAFV